MSLDASRESLPQAQQQGAPPSRDWKDYLTSAEAADLAGLSVNAQDLDRKRRAISIALREIRDRAMQRRRQARIKWRQREAA